MWVEQQEAQITLLQKLVFLSSTCTLARCESYKNVRLYSQMELYKVAGRISSRKCQKLSACLKAASVSCILYFTVCPFFDLNAAYTFKVKPFLMISGT